MAGCLSRPFLKQMSALFLFKSIVKRASPCRGLSYWKMLFGVTDLSKRLGFRVRVRALGCGIGLRLSLKSGVMVGFTCLNAQLSLAE